MLLKYCQPSLSWCPSDMIVHYFQPVQDVVVRCQMVPGWRLSLQMRGTTFQVPKPLPAWNSFLQSEIYYRTEYDGVKLLETVLGKKQMRMFPLAFFPEQLRESPQRICFTNGSGTWSLPGIEVSLAKGAALSLFLVFLFCFLSSPPGPSLHYSQEQLGRLIHLVWGSIMGTLPKIPRWD